MTDSKNPQNGSSSKVIGAPSEEMLELLDPNEKIDYLKDHVQKLISEKQKYENKLFKEVSKAPADQKKDALITELKSNLEENKASIDNFEVKLAKALDKVEEQLKIKKDKKTYSIYDRILRLGSSGFSILESLRLQITDCLTADVNNFDYIQDTLFNLTSSLGEPDEAFENDTELDALETKIVEVQQIAFSFNHSDLQVRKTLQTSVGIQQDLYSLLKLLKTRIYKLKQQISFLKEHRGAVITKEMDQDNAIGDYSGGSFMSTSYPASTGGGGGYIGGGGGGASSLRSFIPDRNKMHFKPHNSVETNKGEEIDPHALSRSIRAEVEHEFTEKTFQMQQELSEAQTKAMIAEKDKTLLSSKFEKTKTEYENLAVKYKKLSASSKENQNKIDEYEKKLQIAKKQIAKLTGKPITDIVDEDQEKLKKVSASFVELKKRYDKLKEDSAKSTEELNSIKQKTAQLEADKKKISEDLEKNNKQFQAQNAELKEKFSNAVKENEKLRKYIDAYKKNKNETKNSMENLRAQLSKVSSDAAQQMKDSNEKFESQLMSNKQSEDKLKLQNKKLLDSLNGLRSALGLSEVNDETDGEISGDFNDEAVSKVQQMIDQTNNSTNQLDMIRKSLGITDDSANSSGDKADQNSLYELIQNKINNVQNENEKLKEQKKLMRAQLGLQEEEEETNDENKPKSTVASELQKLKEENETMKKSLNQIYNQFNGGGNGEEAANMNAAELAESIQSNMNEFMKSQTQLKELMGITDEDQNQDQTGDSSNKEHKPTIFEEIQQLKELKERIQEINKTEQLIPQTEQTTKSTKEDLDVVNKLYDLYKEQGKFIQNVKHIISPESEKGDGQDNENISPEEQLERLTTKISQLNKDKTKFETKLNNIRTQLHLPTDDNSEEIGEEDINESIKTLMKNNEEIKTRERELLNELGIDEKDSQNAIKEHQNTKDENAKMKRTLSTLYDKTTQTLSKSKSSEMTQTETPKSIDTLCEKVEQNVNNLINKDQKLVEERNTLLTKLGFPIDEDSENNLLNGEGGKENHSSIEDIIQTHQRHLEEEETMKENLRNLRNLLNIDANDETTGEDETTSQASIEDKIKTILTENDTLQDQVQSIRKQLDELQEDEQKKVNESDETKRHLNLSEIKDNGEVIEKQIQQLGDSCSKAKNEYEQLKREMEELKSTLDIGDDETQGSSLMNKLSDKLHENDQNKTLLSAIKSKIGLSDQTKEEDIINKLSEHEELYERVIEINSNENFVSEKDHQNDSKFGVEIVNKLYEAFKEHKTFASSVNDIISSDGEKDGNKPKSTVASELQKLKEENETMKKSLNQIYNQFNGGGNSEEAANMNAAELAESIQSNMNEFMKSQTQLKELMGITDEDQNQDQTGDSSNKEHRPTIFEEIQQLKELKERIQEINKTEQLIPQPEQTEQKGGRTKEDLDVVNKLYDLYKEQGKFIQNVKHIISPESEKGDGQDNENISPEEQLERLTTKISQLNKDKTKFETKLNNIRTQLHLPTDDNSEEIGEEDINESIKTLMKNNEEIKTRERELLNELGIDEKDSQNAIKEHQNTKDENAKMKRTLSTLYDKTTQTLSKSKSNPNETEEDIINSVYVLCDKFEQNFYDILAQNEKLIEERKTLLKRLGLPIDEDSENNLLDGEGGKENHSSIEEIIQTHQRHLEEEETMKENLRNLRNLLNIDANDESTGEDAKEENQLMKNTLEQILKRTQSSEKNKDDIPLTTAALCEMVNENISRILEQAQTVNDCQRILGMESSEPGELKETISHLQKRNDEMNTLSSQVEDIVDTFNLPSSKSTNLSSSKGKENQSQKDNKEIPFDSTSEKLDTISNELSNNQQQNKENSEKLQDFVSKLKNSIGMSDQEQDKKQSETNNNIDSILPQSDCDKILSNCASKSSIVNSLQNMLHSDSENIVSDVDKLINDKNNLQNSLKTSNAKASEIDQLKDVINEQNEQISDLKSKLIEEESKITGILEERSAYQDLLLGVKDSIDNPKSNKMSDRVSALLDERSRSIAFLENEGFIDQTSSSEERDKIDIPSQIKQLIDKYKELKQESEKHNNEKRAVLNMLKGENENLESSLFDNIESGDQNILQAFKKLKENEQTLELQSTQLNKEITQLKESLDQIKNSVGLTDNEGNFSDDDLNNLIQEISNKAKIISKLDGIIEMSDKLMSDESDHNDETESTTSSTPLSSTGKSNALSMIEKLEMFNQRYEQMVKENEDFKAEAAKIKEILGLPKDEEISLSSITSKIEEAASENAQLKSELNQIFSDQKDGENKNYDVQELLNHVKSLNEQSSQNQSSKSPLNQMNEIQELLNSQQFTDKDEENQGNENPNVSMADKLKEIIYQQGQFEDQLNKIIDATISNDSPDEQKKDAKTMLKENNLDEVSEKVKQINNDYHSLKDQFEQINSSLNNNGNKQGKTEARDLPSVINSLTKENQDLRAQIKQIKRSLGMIRNNKNGEEEEDEADDNDFSIADEGMNIMKHIESLKSHPPMSSNLKTDLKNAKYKGKDFQIEGSEEFNSLSNGLLDQIHNILTSLNKFSKTDNAIEEEEEEIEVTDQSLHNINEKVNEIFTNYTKLKEENAQLLDDKMKSEDEQNSLLHQIFGDDALPSNFNNENNGNKDVNMNQFIKEKVKALQESQKEISQYQETISALQNEKTENEKQIDELNSKLNKLLDRLDNSQSNIRLQESDLTMSYDFFDNSTDQENQSISDTDNNNKANQGNKDDTENLKEKDIHIQNKEGKENLDQKQISSKNTNDKPKDLLNEKVEQISNAAESENDEDDAEKNKNGIEKSKETKSQTAKSKENKDQDEQNIKSENEENLNDNSDGFIFEKEFEKEILINQKDKDQNESSEIQIIVDVDVQNIEEEEEIQDDDHNLIQNNKEENKIQKDKNSPTSHENEKLSEKAKQQTKKDKEEEEAENIAKEKEKQKQNALQNEEEMKNIQFQNKSFKEKIDDLQQRCAQLEEHVNKLKTKNRKLNKEKGQLCSILGIDVNDENEIQKDPTHKKSLIISNVQAMKESMQERNEENEKLNDLINEQKSKIQDFENNNKEISQQLEDAKKSINALLREKESISKALGVDSDDANESSLVSSIQSLKQLLSESNKEAENLKSNMNEFQEILQQDKSFDFDSSKNKGPFSVQGALGKLKQQLNELNQSNTEKEEIIQDLKKQNKEKQNKITKLNNENKLLKENLNDQKEESENKINKLNNDNKQLKGELKKIQKVQTQYEEVQKENDQIKAEANTAIKILQKKNEINIDDHSKSPLLIEARSAVSSMKEQKDKINEMQAQIDNLNQERKSILSAIYGQTPDDAVSSELFDQLDSLGNQINKQSDILNNSFNEEDDKASTSPSKTVVSPSRQRGSPRSAVSITDAMNQIRKKLNDVIEESLSKDAQIEELTQKVQELEEKLRSENDQDTKEDYSNESKDSLIEKLQKTKAQLKKARRENAILRGETPEAEEEDEDDKKVDHKTLLQEHFVICQLLDNDKDLSEETISQFPIASRIKELQSKIDSLNNENQSNLEQNEKLKNALKSLSNVFGEDETADFSHLTDRIQEEHELNSKLQSDINKLKEQLSKSEKDKDEALQKSQKQRLQIATLFGIDQLPDEDEEENGNGIISQIEKLKKENDEIKEILNIKSNTLTDEDRQMLNDTQQLQEKVKQLSKENEEYQNKIKDLENKLNLPGNAINRSINEDNIIIEEEEEENENMEMSQIIDLLHLEGDTRIEDIKDTILELQKYQNEMKEIQKILDQGLNDENQNEEEIAARVEQLVQTNKDLKTKMESLLNKLSDFTNRKDSNQRYTRQIRNIEDKMREKDDNINEIQELLSIKRPITRRKYSNGKLEEENQQLKQRISTLENEFNENKKNEKELNEIQKILSEVEDQNLSNYSSPSLGVSQLAKRNKELNSKLKQKYSEEEANKKIKERNADELKSQINYLNEEMKKKNKELAQIKQSLTPFSDSNSEDDPLSNLQRLTDGNTQMKKDIKLYEKERKDIGKLFEIQNPPPPVSKKSNDENEKAFPIMVKDKVNKLIKDAKKYEANKFEKVVQSNQDMKDELEEKDQIIQKLKEELQTNQNSNISQYNELVSSIAQTICPEEVKQNESTQTKIGVIISNLTLKIQQQKEEISILAQSKSRANKSANSGDADEIRSQKQRTINTLQDILNGMESVKKNGSPNGAKMQDSINKLKLISEKIDKNAKDLRSVFNIDSVKLFSEKQYKEFLLKIERQNNSMLKSLTETAGKPPPSEIKIFKENDFDIELDGDAYIRKIQTDFVKICASIRQQFNTFSTQHTHFTKVEADYKRQIEQSEKYRIKAKEERHNNRDEIEKLTDTNKKLMKKMTKMQGSMNDSVNFLFALQPSIENTVSKESPFTEIIRIFAFEFGKKVCKHAASRFVKTLVKIKERQENMINDFTRLKKRVEVLERKYYLAIQGSQDQQSSSRYTQKKSKK